MQKENNMIVFQAHGSWLLYSHASLYRIRAWVLVKKERARLRLLIL